MSLFGKKPGEQRKVVVDEAFLAAHDIPDDAPASVHLAEAERVRKAMREIGEKAPSYLDAYAYVKGHERLAKQAMCDHTFIRDWLYSYPGWRAFKCVKCEKLTTAPSESRPSRGIYGEQL